MAHINVIKARLPDIPYSSELASAPWPTHSTGRPERAHRRRVGLGSRGAACDERVSPRGLWEAVEKDQYRPARLEGPSRTITKKTADISTRIDWRRPPIWRPCGPYNEAGKAIQLT